MILNSVRTIVPNAFVDLISLSITVLLLFSSYKRHSRGSKCLNDLLKATRKWWSWDSKPHLQAANPAINHCKVVLTPFIPEGRGRILPFFLHCFHNITQCPALLINRVDGLKFFPFRATFQAWAIIHSYCGISCHRSPRQRVRIMLSTRYTPRPYARAVWATSEIDYTVLWLKEILLHLGRIRCEQLKQIVRNQNVPKHLPRKKKSWVKSRAIWHCSKPLGKIWEKSPSGLRSLELAFEKWVEWGGWEDIAKVRNSQNEVVGPDVQLLLLLLSHALSFPAPPFPSLQSMGNDIVHHLYLKK